MQCLEQFGKWQGLLVSFIMALLGMYGGGHSQKAEAKVCNSCMGVVMQC